MNQRIWSCPYCGLIRTCPDPGYWTPNTICKCMQQEGFITEMEELVPINQRTEVQNDNKQET